MLRVTNPRLAGAGFAILQAALLGLVIGNGIQDSVSLEAVLDVVFPRSMAVGSLMPRTALYDAHGNRSRLPYGPAGATAIFIDCPCEMGMAEQRAAAASAQEEGAAVVLIGSPGRLRRAHAVASTRYRLLALPEGSAYGLLGLSPQRLPLAVLIDVDNRIVAIGPP